MAPRNPILDFQVDRDRIGYIGEGLQRPECILAERDGTLWAADARNGVVRIAPDGRQRLITQAATTGFRDAADDAARFTRGSLPNGLAFAADGSILIANFGTDALEVMDRDGRTRRLLDTLDGQPIGKVNFVLRDRRGRLWLTISTRRRDWMTAVSPKVADGRIVLVDDQGPRVVAEGFAFTNEIRLDAAEEYLYVAETTGRRISRLKLRPDGSLGEREVFGPSVLPGGGFPDGIAFDAHGNLWGTLIWSDQIFAITPDGDCRILFDDGDPAAFAAVAQAFAEDRLTPEILLAAGGTVAPWTASLTFGGPDLRTVFVGSLRGQRIPCFTAPVPGLSMAHW